jgi:hypothetical protein
MVRLLLRLWLQVRNYEVYRLLEESMKAMLTSLPLVQVCVFSAQSTIAHCTQNYTCAITIAIMNIQSSEQESLLNHCD